ncbi:sigma-E factor regulatory protein RseB [Prodigiosinella confusarubida]|uniref:Sigma-E factor regulatory protein RseB n=1 Tax=Serratia sp. (strain ATCC 39006) TaxID=104623 RepID=A0A2I5TI33_SERS3|nr:MULTISPECIES: sigma-E factor regulatory protein RseB [Enterobacterales]WJV57203.1 sigma-E factor regulatory protein RseB [Pectobacteriaceae bacterium C111]WJY16136.1 sigma-E factor regulatory protein RseB [Pectobacteriaceae bacterium CE90]AUG99899.1 sigma-E factor regulatory protein RseB [Serratia sp. ATCC 39006]AUH04219.1 sigma-E factor regulatory protein RseB [Serratia sp. ATCC 39006]WJV52850.1 sigma-E factor regulatory protein RseB [Prodigiosinella sp. LS101]
MKRFWFVACIFFGSLSYSSIALAQNDSRAILQQMSSASQSLNYEMYFINVSHLGIDSLRYRHIIQDKDTLAQLIHLDGPRREILQRGNSIIYHEADMEPFTLSGEHIVDSLPALMFADFQHLSGYYDFIPTGRIRLADRQGDVIRIVSRDGTRFSYVVCLDSETKLPLRVDLLDQNGEMLEQFRAISIVVGDNIQKLMAPLKNLKQPPLLSLSTKTSANFNWVAEWLPMGVEEISRNQHLLSGVNVPVESRFYSDGLFSFSVNISPASETARSERNAFVGRRTVHTEIRDNHEITVIGELPLATAKRIADNIIFKAQ